jgi:two-component system, NarL family, sensor kinase
LLGVLISGYGVLAYARVTRPPLDSAITLAVMVGSVTLGAWLGHTLQPIHLGIWVLGMVFVQTFTGLGMRERLARQHSDALLAELHVAHEQLRASAAQAVENATLRERERLARELHDTLAQGLAATVMHLDTAMEVMATQPDPAIHLIERAQTLARTTMRESRTAILSLASTTSLIDRLMTLSQAIEAEVEVSMGPACQPLPPMITEVCWRVCQEATRNATRHGMARHIQIDLTRTDTRLFLTVTDDGSGFDAEVPRLPTEQGGFGLVAMRQRVAEVGGICDVLSSVGAGTQVAVMIPLEEQP